MSKFKPKTSKYIKVDKNAILTVDQKHQDMLNDINQEESKLVSLEETLSLLKSELDELKNQKLKTNKHRVIELKDQIKTLRKEIQHIKSLRKEYYLNNSQYIFDYFENKKQIIDNVNVNKDIVNSFFKIKTNNKDTNNNSGLMHHRKYFSTLDESFIDMNDYENKYDVCKKCNCEMTIIEHEGIIVCNSCFRQEPYLMEHDKPSYKEPPKEVSFYAYKRINHFREIIAQFQAKESTHISEEVIENIKKQIKKERIELKMLSNDKMKQMLKNLGYNKYYEHISFIKEKLGIFPPRMSIELEQKLCNLFMEIQKPYSKYCPIDRVNFLNYYYVLYKLCELLREDQYLPYFSMLKDQEKRNEQDEIWKLICKDLNWEFIRTP